MKLFCHISEYGDRGWSDLIVSLFLSERITIWAPSFQQLQVAFDKGQTILNPESLIKLIENGRVQVMAREEWFYKSERAKKLQWSHYSWDNKFDDALFELYKESSKLNSYEASVRHASPELGFQWANEVNKESDIYKTALNLYSTNNLPEGIISKANNYRDVQKIDPVTVVLRDARNHADALIECGATFPLVSSDFYNSLNSIYPNKMPVKTSKKQYDPAEIYNLIDFLGKISNISSNKDLFKRLKLPEYIRLSEELDNILHSDTSILDQIFKEYDLFIKRRNEESGLNRAFSDSVGSGLSFISLIISLCTYTISPGGIASVFFSLGALSPLFIESFKERSLIQYGYTGFNIPNIVGQNTKKPTKAQIEEMKAKILEVLKETRSI